MSIQNAMTQMILSKNCSLPINYCCTLCNIANNIEICPETVLAIVKTKKPQKAQPQTTFNGSAQGKLSMVDTKIH